MGLENQGEQNKIGHSQARQNAIGLK